MQKKIILRWVKIIIVAYCLIGIAIYYFQDRLLLRPKQIALTDSFDIHVPFKEVNIPFNATSNISIVQFLTKNKPKGLVLYFHGNRVNISRYARFVPEFTRNGYEVWMLDYPGFGKSTGEFTEQTLYNWALLLYKLGRNRFPPDSIIIYGKSFGTGIAAQLASVRDTRRLILETPYYSVPSIIQQYAPVYPLQQMIHLKIPTYQFLQKVTAPITILHGSNDWVIRLSNAKKLQPFLKAGDEFIIIEGGKHNNLHNYDLFQQKLDSLLTH